MSQSDECIHSVKKSKKERNYSTSHESNSNSLVVMSNSQPIGQNYKTSKSKSSPTRKKLKKERNDSGCEGSNSHSFITASSDTLSSTDQIYEKSKYLTRKKRKNECKDLGSEENNSNHSVSDEQISKEIQETSIIKRKKNKKLKGKTIDHFKFYTSIDDRKDFNQIQKELFGDPVSNSGKMTDDTTDNFAISVSETKTKKKKKKNKVRKNLCETSHNDKLSKCSLFDSISTDIVTKSQIDFKDENSLHQNLSSGDSVQNRGRQYTLSIAIPVSILCDTAISQMHQTYVIGCLARAACIYSVDEIIIFDDDCWNSSIKAGDIEYYIDLMKTILEYQECPQYLRRSLFKESKLLKCVGILNPLNATHHLLIDEWCTYREGVVLQSSARDGSIINVGFDEPVNVDEELEPYTRVTVKFPPMADHANVKSGYIVSSDEPREEQGLHWGYTVRVAYSLSEVFNYDGFADGYDLIIGTSDKGTDSNKVKFPKFTHGLIVFGGVHGLEVALKKDKTLNRSDIPSLFPYYLNVCPYQATRTIRTEEAVLIALSNLYPKLLDCQK